MTWFITGGCGFGSANLADALLSKRQAVVIHESLLACQFDKTRKEP